MRAANRASSHSINSSSSLSNANKRISERKVDRSHGFGKYWRWLCEQSQLGRTIRRDARFDFAAAVLELDTLTNLRLRRDTFFTRFSCCKPLFRLQNELIEYQRLPCYFSWNHDILAPLARCQPYSCEPPPPSCGPCIRSWVLPVQAGATWSCRLGGWSRGGTMERSTSACAFQQGHIHGRRRPEERFRVRRG